MGGIYFGVTDAMRRKRRCSKCGKEVIVPREKARETVRCASCGADVPPPSSSR
jgi:ribosomal protein S27E